MILVAVALADYKAYSQLDALENIRRLTEHPVSLHVTLQSRRLELWEPLFARCAELSRAGIPCHVEQWGEGWAPRDVEDPGVRDDRVSHIARARNIAREYGHRAGVSHIFYLDSDVAVPDGSVDTLLRTGAPLAGGIVRSHDPRCEGIPYVFRAYRDGVAGNHYVRDLPDRGLYRQADFITAGFLLVARVALDIPWREEPARTPAGERWGEDPLFFADAYPRFGKPVVDCGLVARHHHADGHWV